MNADSYLDQLRAETDRRFDSDFYFDPTGMRTLKSFASQVCGQKTLN